VLVELLVKTLETGLSQQSEDLGKLISSLTFPQLVFKESNLLSMMETIYSYASYQNIMLTFKRYFRIELKLVLNDRFNGAIPALCL
jgi:hypothetical protein